MKASTTLQFLSPVRSAGPRTRNAFLGAGALVTAGACILLTGSAATAAAAPGTASSPADSTEVTLPWQPKVRGEYCSAVFTNKYQRIGWDKPANLGSDTRMVIERYNRDTGRPNGTAKQFDPNSTTNSGQEVGNVGNDTDRWRAYFVGTALSGEHAGKRVRTEFSVLQPVSTGVSTCETRVVSTGGAPGFWPGPRSLVTPENGAVLTLGSASGKNASVTSSLLATPVSQRAPGGNNPRMQNWILQGSGDTFQLKSMSSNQCMSASFPASDGIGRSVNQVGCGSDATWWRIVPAAEGGHKLVNTKWDSALDVPGGTEGDIDLVAAAPNAGAVHQVWNFFTPNP
ncbi:RICIN domain-containing protein [Streptomyces sp. IBSNAI002]|uniref:RICIN domain-containing protein n=1 Tax=Streptomyces sp. IBSNAI002 TaxID=3457500 RepID=UPI003FCFC3CA